MNFDFGQIAKYGAGLVAVASSALFFGYSEIIRWLPEEQRVVVEEIATNLSGTFQNLRGFVGEVTNIPMTGGSPSSVPSVPVGEYAGYNREEYGGWTDPDGNCMDTRAEILKETSTGQVSMRSNGCSVDRGRWIDPYTDQIFTEASKLDIDHIVPLAWAHAHGAAQWPRSRKQEFATWMPNLIPVDGPTNREKGAKGPTEWLPPNDAYKCEYIIRFQRIALQWELVFSPDEQRQMNAIATQWCN